MKIWNPLVRLPSVIACLLLTFNLTASASVSAEPKGMLLIESVDTKFKPCSTKQNFLFCPDQFSAFSASSVNVNVKAMYGDFSNVHLVAVDPNFFNDYFVIQPPTSCSKLTNNQVCTFTLTAQTLVGIASSTVYVVANNQNYLSFLLINLGTT